MAHLLQTMMGKTDVGALKITSDEMGIPTVDTSMKLLKVHVEAVNRCKQLVPLTHLY